MSGVGIYVVAYLIEFALVGLPEVFCGGIGLVSLGGCWSKVFSRNGLLGGNQW